MTIPTKIDEKRAMGALSGLFGDLCDPRWSQEWAKLAKSYTFLGFFSESLAILVPIWGLLWPRRGYRIATFWQTLRKITKNEVQEPFKKDV